MPAPFQRLTIEQFAAVLTAFEFRRRITGVHMHHTWRPNHAMWRGHDSVVGMWRFHTQERGFSDIAQHLTIDPEGQVWTGRNWNLSPASAVGHNGSATAGPADGALVQRTLRLIEPDPVAARSTAAAMLEELDYDHGTEAAALAGPRGGGSGSAPTPEQIDALRPYVLNLRMGGFSNNGLMTSSAADVDMIVNEHLKREADAAQGGERVCDGTNARWGLERVKCPRPQQP